MTAVGVTRDEPSPALSRQLVKWLPPLLILVAIAGVVAVVPSVSSDENGRSWYRDTLGGRELYRLNVLFARLVPFLAGGSIAFALMQRRVWPARERHTVDTLQRHGITEVLIHWLNAIGIGLCLITAIWILDWFGNPVSLETTYVIHYLGAGFSVVAVAHHLTYQLVGGGRGLITRSRADVKNAIAEVVAYTGVYRGMPGVFGLQLPPAVRRPAQSVLRRLNLAPDRPGKYLATEKVVSYTGWAILVGIVVVTGVIKALNYIYSIPGWLLQAMTFLHDGATIFFVIMLVMHLGALVLVPRNWQLLKSMFTTRVSRRYAEEHLPLWAEEERQSQSEPGGS